MDTACPANPFASQLNAFAPIGDAGSLNTCFSRYLVAWMSASAPVLGLRLGASIADLVSGCKKYPTSDASNARTAGELFACHASFDRD